MQEELGRFLDEIVDSVTAGINDFESELPREPEGDGEYIQLIREEKGFSHLEDLGGLRSFLEGIAEKELSALYWRRRTAYETKCVVQQAGEEDIEKVRKTVVKS